MILQGHTVSQENIKVTYGQGRLSARQTTGTNLIWSRKLSWIQWSIGEKQQTRIQSNHQKYNILKRKKTPSTLETVKRLFSCTKNILSDSNLICSQYFLNLWMETTHLQWFNNKMVLLIQAVICCHFYTKGVLFWGSPMSFIAKTVSTSRKSSLHHRFPFPLLLLLLLYYQECSLLCCTVLLSFSLTHCQCLSYLISDVCTPQKNWGFR